METGTPPGGLESDTPSGRSDSSHSTRSASPTPPVHRIRLGPPWERTPIDGRHLHTRRFGRPRTLDPDVRVWVVCISCGPAEISLNGAQIGIMVDFGTNFSADITDRLKPRNELQVTAQSIEPPAVVALEIRPAVTS